MTQAEVELVAREIRSRCLHSSWSDLVTFWDGVMDNLVGAYRAVLQCIATTDRASSADIADIQVVARDKLAIALSHLTGHRQANNK